MIFEAQFLPPALRDRAPAPKEQVVRTARGEVRFRRVPVASSLLAAAAEALREAGRALRSVPIAEIVAALDAASARWLDPAYEPRARAVEGVAAISGLSPEMVALSIDLEMRSSRAPDLLAALRSELGSEAVLDGYAPAGRKDAWATAVGPGLVGGVFSANIPALPHLSMMRALLVKSPFLGKSASAEPIFAPLYARTLEEVDPRLGAAAAVLSWPGGGDLDDALLAACDHVIAYGGPRAEAELRRKLPPGKGLTFHGHRIGFGALSKEALAAKRLEPLAKAVAWDATVFDQKACLSPQAYFLEAEAEAAHAFARRVAREMDALARTYPFGALTDLEVWRIREFRETAALEAAASPEALLLASEDPRGWTLAVTGEVRLEPSPLCRTLRLVLVRSLDDVLAALAPWRGALQNAVFAGEGEAAERFCRELAALGVSRIAPPGDAPTPSMAWRHDGRPRIGELVRWCEWR